MDGWRIRPHHYWTALQNETQDPLKRWKGNLIISSTLPNVTLKMTKQCFVPIWRTPNNDLHTGECDWGDDFLYRRSTSENRWKIWNCCANSLTRTGECLQMHTSQNANYAAIQWYTNRWTLNSSYSKVSILKEKCIHQSILWKGGLL